MKTIDVTDSVYARLANHAKGFDTPSDVIERLLDDLEDPKASDSVLDAEQGTRKSLSTFSVVSDPQPDTRESLSNSEIQIRISRVLSDMPEEVVDLFCDKQHSKKVFGINLPLLVKVPGNADQQVRLKAVKSGGVNRWTWKYSIHKGRFVYAICTQWFRWNDDSVKQWLESNERSHRG